MKIKLSKPIKAHGEEHAELDLAEPTTKDVMELGYPYLVVPSDDDDTGFELRPKVAARYISRLAKIPMSSVEQLAIADLQQLQGTVMSFFGSSEEQKTSSKTESSSLRTSGESILRRSRERLSPSSSSTSGRRSASPSK